MKPFSDKLLASDFVTGAIGYTDYHVGEQVLARMVIPIFVEGRTQSVQAIVDTGAEWSVFNPKIIKGVTLEELSSQATDRKHIMVRGTLYEGQMVRVGVTLKADYGDDLTIDATVFVPLLELDDKWPWINFLGMDGFLDRMNSAIAPTESVFYFGPV